MSTEIPNNRNQFERQQQNPNQEGLGIQAQNFGGLNTISSPLAIPYEDSPALLNCVVDVSGAIEKRKGSRVVRHEATAATGITVVPVTTALGYSFQVAKIGTAIKLYELRGNSLELVMTKSNVWSSAASSVKATYTATSEAEARIIFATGVNVPVQLLFTENRILRNVVSPTSTIVISNAERLATAATTNVLCYVDGVLTTVNSYSYNGTTKELTLSFASDVAAGNRVIDIILVTWQWWAESLFYYGDRFWDSTLRLHAKGSDRHVAIPENLRDGVVVRKDYPTLYPLQVLYYKKPNYLYYTPFSNRVATGPAQYVFSDGNSGNPIDVTWRGVPTAGQTVFTINTTNKNFYSALTTNTNVLYNGTSRSVASISFNGTVLTVTLSAGVNPSGAFEDVLYVVYNPEQHTPSPFFVSFGSIDSGRTTDVDTIYISRERELTFNGGRGASGNNLFVSRDGITQTQNGTNYGDFRLYAQDVGYVVLMNGTDTAGFIDFTGGVEAGVPANAKIRITNKEVKYVGSAALSTNVARVDGSWIPAYGLGSYANYDIGSFPANVSSYQNRICFSGFPHNPLLVCMSSVSDTTLPGEYGAFFQQDVFTTLPTDPLDVLISSTPDDFITGMTEYQGSLFVFTRRATYRVGTQGRGAVTADNVYVLSVASTGLVNAQSLVKAEDTVIFLSDEGVFVLTNGAASQETTEYRLEELSTKIRNRIDSGVRNASQLCWMSYDDVSNALVVALPRKGETSYASDIYSFMFFRQAWSQVDTVGGFKSVAGLTCKDISNNSQFLLVVSRASNGFDTVDTTFLKMNYERYIDFVVEGVATGSEQSYKLQSLPRTTHTISPRVKDYPIGFSVLSMTDVEDVVVKIDGNRLNFGTEFIKISSNKIRLLSSYQNGTLVISYRRPDADYPAGQAHYNTTSKLDLTHSVVYVDNIAQKETIDYPAMSGSPDVDTVLVTAAEDSKVEVGSVYPTMYSTPLFTWNTLKQFKRLLYWLGFFDNTFALETYSASDANSASGQQPEDIEGIPKTRLDCNVSFIYNSSQYGDTSTDQYGFQDLVWDVSIFDEYLPLQIDDYVLLKQALQGVGYSFQGVVWSTDEASFRMVGYQLDGKVKGNKYSHRSN